MTKNQEHKFVQIPEHVAIIMDGNGRWAKKQGAMRIFGHKSAIKSVREAAAIAGELGVKYLTLYAFSTENWARPKEEVDALMELLVSTLMAEANDLHKNNVRLTVLGNFEGLPRKCQNELSNAMRKTEANTGLNLVLALNYSGRWEIAEAAKTLAKQVKDGNLKPEDITEDLLAKALPGSFMPDPELLIRTSGELRISNFLLWQLAYTEIYITEVLWPDFRKKDFIEAIEAYQLRERRFGKTSEQLVNAN